MAKGKPLLKGIGVALICAAIVLLCWLGVYSRTHSGGYLLLGGEEYVFVYNPMYGEPGKLLGTVGRQTSPNVFPWTMWFSRNLDSNILPEGTPVYENLAHPDSVIVYWEEKGSYYNCYRVIDGFATIPGEAAGA